MTYKSIFRLAVCFMTLACTKIVKEPTFGMVFEIKPGTSTRVAVLKSFGEPLAKTQEDGDEGESWRYVNANIPKVLVFFLKGSDTVQSILWDVGEKEKESDLRTALALFPAAKWKVEPPEWINPHVIPTECYFQDDSLGVSVEYNSSRSKVETILRWHPQRATASVAPKKEPPPQACIAEDCVNFMSREEFKKASTWEPCKIPK